MVEKSQLLGLFFSAHIQVLGCIPLRSTWQAYHKSQDSLHQYHVPAENETIPSPVLNIVFSRTRANQTLSTFVSEWFDFYISS